MEHNIYWDIFAQNGSVDAYLAYKYQDKLMNGKDTEEQGNTFENTHDNDNGAVFG